MSNAGFVKLYASIFGSSLMDEDLPTRWLFVCFLIEADAEGFVRCQTTKAAARLANMTEDQAARALAALAAPDPESTSPEEGGRRILRAEGGWVCVNHGKYREMLSPSAIRMRRHRAKASHGDGVTVTASRRDSVTAEAEAEAEANGKRNTTVEEDEREETEDARAREAVSLEGVKPPPKAGQARAAKIAEAYLRTFNSAFGRRVAAVSVQRAITARVKARLKDGIEGALLVALPLLARAEGSGDYLARDPLILLRDGTHAKTRNGQTSGATDHALGFAGRLDQIELPGRLTEAAKAAGVANWLHHQGVIMKNPAPEPPPESRDVHSSASQEAPRPRAARGGPGGD